MSVYLCHSPLCHHIICDLEATCWAEERRPQRMEIIEIGAVKLASAGGPALDEFSAFVRPLLQPTLSDYCRELTGITQADVDGAEPFPAVLERLVAWMGEPPLRFCSWGQYDLNQLRQDCQRHNIAFPAHFAHHLNVKNAWAKWKGVKPRGLARALRLMGMELEGPAPPRLGRRPQYRADICGNRYRSAVGVKQEEEENRHGTR